MQLTEILQTADKQDASDVHLISGHPPIMRVHTVMTPMDLPILTPKSVRDFLDEMVTEKQVARFEDARDLDFSYEVQGLGRYRVNAHYQRGAIGLAMRIIKAEVPPLEDLNLPEIISRLTYLPRGLVLVTGDTGSGKSTSLAAMIQAMNERYRKHIITLEDPIEYSFQSNKCLLEQRELGDDMPSFSSGLKHALRQDP
ncbi:MAG: type IV pilus twitching motility protein PilT, partial [Planctomycetota bacterium]